MLSINGTRKVRLRLSAPAAVAAGAEVILHNSGERSGKHDEPGGVPEHDAGGQTQGGARALATLHRQYEGRQDVHTAVNTNCVMMIDDWCVLSPSTWQRCRLWRPRSGLSGVVSRARQ